MDKKTALKTLLNEVSLIDPQQGVIYFPETDEEPHRFFGIREYRLKQPVKNLKKEAAYWGSITEYCLANIPFDDIETENENGSSILRLPGKDISDGLQDSTEIQNFLESFLSNLDKEGILKNCKKDGFYEKSVS